MLALFLIALGACHNSDCGAGEVWKNGACRPAPLGDGDTGTTGDTADAGLGDVLSRLGPCVPGDDDGTVDLGSLCADGICVGMTEGEAEAVKGSPSCYPPAYGSPWMYCGWSDGVGAWLAASGYGSKPDPSAALAVVYVGEPFAGGTAGGLSLGATMSCFHDAFGRPTAATLVWDGTRWYATRLVYGDAKLEFDDYLSSSGFGSDGETDGMILGSYGD